MDAKLLFASGSTKVDSEGIKALKELAKVLEDQKDLEILVEGHTDTDKMRSNSHPVDNWELSVLKSYFCCKDNVRKQQNGSYYR